MATLGITHPKAYLGHRLEAAGPSSIAADIMEVHRARHRVLS